MIDKLTRLKRNDGKFLTSNIGNEAVMMNIDNGNFIGLNNIGAEIWDLLKTPVTVSELVSHLTDQYDIAEEQCSSQTIAYLTRMMEEHMLIPA